MQQKKYDIKSGAFEINFIKNTNLHTTWYLHNKMLKMTTAHVEVCMQTFYYSPTSNVHSHNRHSSNVGLFPKLMQVHRWVKFLLKKKKILIRFCSFIEFQ